MLLKLLLKAFYLAFQCLSQRLICIFGDVGAVSVVVDTSRAFRSFAITLRRNGSELATTKDNITPAHIVKSCAPDVHI